MKKKLKLLFFPAWLLINFCLLVASSPPASAAEVPYVWSDQPDLPRPLFIDISNNNGGWLNNQDQFYGLKAQGAEGAVVKLSQGTSFVDSWAGRYTNWARNAGMRVSAYHYCEYDDNAQAYAEANHFADVAESIGLPKDTLMVLDVEKNAGIGGIELDGHRDPTQISLACANRLKERGFSNIAYYTMGSWIGDGDAYPMEPRYLGNDNIWAAGYLYSVPNINNLQYPNLSAWQFTDRMMFRGVSNGQGQVLDANVDYMGRFTGAQAPTPTPVSTPSEPTVNDVYMRALFIQNGRDDGIFTAGPLNNFIGTVTTTGNDRHSITVEKQVTIDGVTWDGGYMNSNRTDFIWFDDRAVVPDNTAPVPTNYLATIVQDNRVDGVFIDMPWEYRSDFYGLGSDLNHLPINVVNEWTTPDGVTWVNFFYDGKSLWMDKAGISGQYDVENINQRALFIQNGRDDGIFVDAPWPLGSAFIGTVISTGNDRHSVTLEKKVTINGVTWYGGFLDSNRTQFGFFDARAVTFDNSSPVQVDFEATISQNNRDDGLFIGSPWEYRSGYDGTAKSLNGQQVRITGEWDTPDGVDWVSFNYDGYTIWMDKAGIVQN